MKNHQRRSACSLQPVFSSPSLCKRLKLELILLSAQIGCVRKELSPSWMVPAWSICAAPQRQVRLGSTPALSASPSWRTRFPGAQGVHSCPTTHMSSALNLFHPLTISGNSFCGNLQAKEKKKIKKC